MPGWGSKEPSMLELGSPGKGKAGTPGTNTSALLAPATSLS